MAPDTALAGIILAGGKSSRFGADKGRAPFLGVPMLERVLGAVTEVCDPVIVVRAAGTPPLNLGVAARAIQIEDRSQDGGPLVALVGGLAACRDGWSFVATCDAPLLQPSLIRGLAGLRGDAVAAICPIVAGRVQPLIALYHVRPALAAFERALVRGERSITRALNDCAVRYVAEDALRRWDPDLRSFRSPNTPAELADLEAFAAGNPA